MTLLRSPRYVAFALCSACASGAWFTFCANTPHVLDEVLHEPPSTYGVMILLPMLTYMLGNAGAARFAMRWGTARLLVIGRLDLLRLGRIGMVLWFAACSGSTPGRCFCRSGFARSAMG